MFLFILVFPWLPPGNHFMPVCVLCKAAWISDQ